MAKRIQDEDIIALNSVGMSLVAISKRLDCHHTTVTNRLTELGIPLADTRRAFMEAIFDELTKDQQQWLISCLGPTHSVKDLVKNLIVAQYTIRNLQV